VDAGYLVDRPLAEKDAFDWLSYRHWPCYAGRLARAKETPVTDADAYNQSLPRADLHATADVTLVCRLQASGAGRLAFAAYDRRHILQAVIDPAANRCSLTINDRELLSVELPKGVAEKLSGGQPIDAEFGLCDRQVCLALNGVSLLRTAYRREASGTQPARSLTIGSQRMRLTVTDLQVYRDIYYVGPGDEGRWIAPSSPKQGAAYFLLGDNPPASIDSRHWPRGVRSGEIVGIVKKR
jgi:hypothetical protein